MSSLDNLNDIDNIYDNDFEFLESDKQHGSFYFCVLLQEGPLLMSTISTKALCQYSGTSVLSYLQTYSTTDPSHLLPGIRLVRLCMLPSGEHIGIDFTFVIVRIQRRWRKRYHRFITKRIKQIQFRECHGHFLTNCI